MKLQSTRPSVMKKVKKNTSHDFRMIKDNLSEIIEMMVDMYRTDALRVPVHTLYRLCKQTGFSMFLKNQLMTGGSHSSLSSYYIGKLKMLIQQLFPTIYFRNG